MTVLSAVMATVQVLPVTLSQPSHSVKLEPEAGVAVRVRVVPLVYVEEHVDPQLIPEGLPVIVPLPVPDLMIEIVRIFSNVAVTVMLPLTVTVHVLVPEQPLPLQPVKTEPDVAAAVRVTTEPLFT